jgi:phosphatidate cytidylyltransferase
LTAVIFIPVVLGAIWMGKPYVDVLAIFILFCMTREWSKMVMGTVFSPFGYSLTFLTMALFYLDLSPKLYTKLVLFSFALSFIYHLYLHKRWRDYLIYSIGACYMTGALFILIYMAHEGLELFFMWMMLIIWASDTGAYFAGRFIGGPKLAPAISPNKTWAGFCGGLVFAALVGFLTAPYLQEIYITPLHIICVALYLSFMGHIGDLLESLVKRYYHVKDSGSILPGHGGMLDRFDSLLLVSFAAGLLLFLGL